MEELKIKELIKQNSSDDTGVTIINDLPKE